MPTHRAGGERKDRIRLKNLIQTYEKLLERREVAPDEIKTLAAPLHAMLEDDRSFRHLSDGMAVFRSPDYHSVFHLPISFNERVTLEDRFYLKPLFPLLTGDGRFFVVAFSQSEIRLLEGGRDYVRSIDIDDLLPPTVDALRRAGAPRPNIQAHGSQAGALHGHGAGKDDRRTRRFQYARMVARAVEQVIGAEDAPLLFAGLERHFGIYREVNKYPHLVTDLFIRGNPEREDIFMLHERAWQLLGPRFKVREIAALEKFQSFHATERTSFDIDRILPAARTGRVETLFVRREEDRPGRAPAGIHDEELIANDAAIQTLFRGGEVFVVGNREMPGRSDMAALFRF